MSNFQYSKILLKELNLNNTSILLFSLSSHLINVHLLLLHGNRRKYLHLAVFVSSGG